MAFGRANNGSKSINYERNARIYYESLCYFNDYSCIENQMQIADEIFA